MTSSAISAGPTSAPTPGRYVIRPESTTIRFTTRHLFGLGRVRGTVALREAELVVESPPTSTYLLAVLDAATFETGNAQRDATVRSAKYLDTTNHPDITFAAESVRRDNDGWVASGHVTAHGVTAPVELILDAFDEHAREVTLHARARIDRYAHGITGGKGLAGRWLTVDISARGAR